MFKKCGIKNKQQLKEIQAMLKLIPNGVSVTLEDLIEIYSKEEKNEINTR